MSFDLPESLMIAKECEALVVKFLDHWDQGNAATIGALFTDDGVFDRAGSQLAGPSMIAEAVRGRPASILGRHIVSNFNFNRLSAEEATAKMYVTAYLATVGATGGPVVHEHSQPMLLDFEGHFRQTETGWRIARLDAVLVLAPDTLLRR